MSYINTLSKKQKKKKKKTKKFTGWIFSGREIYNLSRIDVQVLSISIKILLKKVSIEILPWKEKIYILSNFLSFLIIKKKKTC